MRVLTSKERQRAHARKEKISVTLTIYTVPDVLPVIRTESSKSQMFP